MEFQTKKNRQKKKEKNVTCFVFKGFFFHINRFLRWGDGGWGGGFWEQNKKKNNKSKTNITDLNQTSPFFYHDCADHI